MAKLQKQYECAECGAVSLQWRGQCASCGAWNALVETTVMENANAPRGNSASARSANALTHINDVNADEVTRLPLHNGELDRVLGGGVVPGSLVLIGGEPGIGKSTLFLDVLSNVANDAKAIYFSGEESMHQVKLRANRLNANARHLFLSNETNVDDIVRLTHKEKPKMIVVDSLQTLYTDDLTSLAGSVAQIRDSAQKLLTLAKASNTVVFLIGHITKAGNIAGPKLLEHTVDCVLYFEGDAQSQYRILRGVKNRFGAIDEIGIFEMTGEGLKEVADPTYLFACDDEREAYSGTAFVPLIEGSRVFCVEEQALVCPTAFGYPRRLAMGFDQNRLVMLAAALEKRARVPLQNQDVHVNVAQGLRVKETASDLGVAMAIVSSALEKPLPKDATFIGEIGLSGELRPVRFIERRLKEMKKFGITRAFVPKANLREKTFEGITLIGVQSVKEAIDRTFGG